MRTRRLDLGRVSRQPQLGRITPEARRSLRQRGLLSGVWPRRLASASQHLIRFINRFHRVAGFERLLRDYFAGRYKRGGALLTMRFAQQLASRQPDFARRLAFQHTLVFAPDSLPIEAVSITRNGTHYQIRPWSRIYPQAIRRQWLRDMALFGSPDRVRWVFDRGRLRMRKPDVVRQVRRILTSDRFGTSGHPDQQRWLNALSRIIVLV